MHYETGGFTNLFLIILTSGVFVEPSFSLLFLLVFLMMLPFSISLIIFTLNGYIPWKSVARILSEIGGAGVLFLSGTVDSIILN